MFKLDFLFINYVLSIFPWSNYSFYGFGIYAKVILILIFGKRIFNVVYDSKKKKGGKKHAS